MPLDLPSSSQGTPGIAKRRLQEGYPGRLGEGKDPTFHLQLGEGFLDEVLGRMFELT